MDEGGRSILFGTERGIGLSLQVLVDGRVFVIGWMVAITENTAS
jgi:hypothetical protein